MAMKKQMKSAIESLGYKVYGNLVMVDGELYPLPLVQGNTKLGKKVWHSSTLPTNEMITCKSETGEVITEKGTCPMSCTGCYATKGNYQFDSTKYRIMMRTRLLRRHPQAYFDLVAIQLRYENIEKLRIHATGDFIQGEARGFYDVLQSFPHVKAWTYTKVQNDADVALLDTLPNCNIVKSIIKGCGFNFGHVAYIANMFYYLKRLGKSVYICRCGIDENQHCSNCDGCSDHEYVLFVEHSTGYNAQADYGYSKLVQLIESQAEAK